MSDLRHIHRLLSIARPFPCGAEEDMCAYCIYIYIYLFIYLFIYVCPPRYDRPRYKYSEFLVGDSTKIGSSDIQRLRKSTATCTNLKLIA